MLAAALTASLILNVFLLLLVTYSKPWAKDRPMIEEDDEEEFYQPSKIS